MEKGRGVALIIENPLGEILVLQELEEKSRLGKKKGMFSIPMETVEQAESDVAALKRLIDEELPGLAPKIKIIETQSFRRYRIAPGVWATLYTAVISDNSLPSVVGSEVTGHKWVRLREALTLWLRKGARDMISDYIEGRSFVVRFTTI